MAGLLDAHVMAGSAKALEMVRCALSPCGSVIGSARRSLHNPDLQVKAMAAYFLKRIDAVVKEKGESYWQQARVSY